MVYEVPLDLYKEWKELMYKKVLYLNIVEEPKKKYTEEKDGTGKG